MDRGKLHGMRLIALITAMALLVPATASAQAPLREYEGEVVSVNREAKRFRLHDSERGTIRVHVNRNTRWERIDRMAGLRVGMRRVEVLVRRIDGRWIASEVEKSGGGGEHGGGDRGGGGNSGPGSGGSNS